MIELFFNMKRYMKIFTLALIASFFALSCAEKEYENPIKGTDWLLVVNQYTVYTQEELTITPTYSSDNVNNYNFVWTVENPDIVRIVEDNNTSITIEGLKPGRTRIKVECPGESKRLSANFSVLVEQAPLRILAIGNSFSQDAVEQYLWNLFNAAGIESVIGNMYIGGCSLEKHWSNAQNNSVSYEYRKVVGGDKTNNGSISLVTALKDEKWDYISLQQVSGLSGQYDTYKPYLQNMIDYVTSMATNKNMQLMFHQTWAYSSDSNHADFPKYDSDQATMYNAIIAASNQAMQEHSQLKIMIPAGTAIQNGRTSYIGDAFNRDGYHLETTYGRYTAACVWFETIAGQSVVGNSYVPGTLNPTYAAIAQNAAHLAVQNPTSVTAMTDFSLKAVFMGDSITENWNKTSTGHPDFFTTNLYKGKGISGQTTSQMLARFDTDVVSLAPKCVVICGGTNDIAGNQGEVTDQSIVDNISAMAAKADAAGIKVILASILPCNYYYWKPQMKPAERIISVNAMIKALAEEKGYAYVDYHTPMKAEDGSLQEKYTSDGCHPTKAGYDAMESIVVPVIENVLK